MSAARLVHRTLAVTPPAALAVALADHDHDHDHATAATNENAVEDDHRDDGAAAVPVDRKLGLDEDPPVVVEELAEKGKEKGKGKGRGRKRGRSEMGVTATSADNSEEGREVRDGRRLDEDGGRGAGEERRRRHSRGEAEAGSGSGKGGRATAAGSCPCPSLFVAGQAVTGVASGTDMENGASRASVDVFVPSSDYSRRRFHCLSKPSTVATVTTTTTTTTCMSAVEEDSSRRRRGDEPQPEAEPEWAESAGAGGASEHAGCGGGGRGGGGHGGWAGMRDDGEARELCRRVKGRLVGLFHRGAMYGYSTLVEVCLQVRARW